MKKTVKKLGIAVLAATLVFAFVGCEETEEPPPPPPTVINIAAIQGVTVPAKDGIPVTAIIENTQYSGTVEWSPYVNYVFANSTVYTATITLTAKSGYTLQGVAADFFTVAGAKSVSNDTNSGVITALFSATAPTSTSSVSISITAPVKGATPRSTASGVGNFSIGLVSWSPNNNPFLGNMEYTASVTLTAHSGYTFAGLSSATINGQNATISINTSSIVTLSYKFPKTDEKAVSSIAIKTQPTKLTYTHGDTLDLTGLAVTLTHDDSTTEDVVAASFEAKNITADPSAGNSLVRSTHNGQSIKIKYGSLTCNTNNLTVAPKVTNFTVDSIPAQAYIGGTIQPTVTVKDGTTILTLSTDYTVSYTNNINAGTAAVTITGLGNYVGSSGSKTFTINPKVINFTVDSIPAQTYTGDTIQPTVTVKDGTTILTLSTDYTVSYTNNINAGTAAVTITGLGNYAGSYCRSTFIINPIVITFNSVTANGSALPLQSSTQLTLTFSQAIIGLSANDITISGVSDVNKGTLSGSGPTYILPISGFTEDGTLTVAVAKSGYTISGTSKPVIIYYYYNGVSPGLIEMASIPAGTFIMGSPTTEPNRDSGEKQHSVTLSGFSMSKYQVTQAQWFAVMGKRRGVSLNYGGGDNFPIYYVNWYEAIVFCNKLSIIEGLNPVYIISDSTNPADWGTVPTSNDDPKRKTWDAVVMDRSKNGYRLPTEAEWEYACRGDYPNKATETNTKPFGIGVGTKMVSGMANFYDWKPYDLAQSGEYSASGTNMTIKTVGSYAANNYGLYDMHGNVREWCWDWWGTYSSVSQTNPTGAVSAPNRVRRGGNLSSSGQALRSAYRGASGATIIQEDTSFLYYPSSRGYLDYQHGDINAILYSDYLFYGFRLVRSN